MATERQLHHRDLPSDDEETLPDYEQYEERELGELPTYERSSISVADVKLRFLQIDRKHVFLQPVDEDQPFHYRIVTRGKTGMFSKQPDMTLYFGSTTNDMAVATFEFDNSTTIPWCPRANVTVEVAGNGVRTIPMESNFCDWFFEWNDARFTWTLQERPTSLALVDRSNRLVIARFNYSDYGTTANKGQEVGDLAIALGEHGLTTELVISTCAIAIKYWAKQGKHHRRDLCCAGRYGSGSGMSLNGATWTGL